MIRKRVHIGDGGTIAILAEPTPIALDQEAVIEFRASGICGTDISARDGQHPYVPLPYYPGHEAVGAVIEAPEGTDLRPGDLVTVIPTLWCGRCKNCLRGLTNICENMQFFGTGYREGGMAERYLVDTKYLFRVPDGLSVRQAALIEPLATPLHAVDQAPDVAGRAVVVIGSGTIGRLVLAVLRHRGVGKVAVVDLDPKKLEIAAAMGAETIQAGTGDLNTQGRAALGESADIVFDCVSTQQTLSDAIRLADRGGTVMTVGVPHGPVNVDLPLLQDHQIEIRGTITYLPRDYSRAAELISSGVIAADDYITSCFALDDAEAAFDAARSGKERKVLLVAESEL
ncbi:MAG: alcohol dehydrogenase catalytic domain-containing protein [Propionibacteriaceae bacterium]|jgi:2-desacetyl-2-hydroxyethyl bacteriochlorophyllide A dehydrogenase|nr:alcohol dehydrogenase catalytic domain-containing protein [Propionibacteriaceae bacterium]